MEGGTKKLYTNQESKGERGEGGEEETELLEGGTKKAIYESRWGREPKISQSVKPGKRHVGLGGAVDLVEWCPVVPGPHPLNAFTFWGAWERN